MIRRFYDPDGRRYGVPTYPFRWAPPGLATRRQLRSLGLRPGGQEIAAQVMWASRRYSSGHPRVRVAYLYRTDRARPVRPMTPAKWTAIGKALAARRTCPDCRLDRGYTIPTSLGVCLSCADTTTAPAAIAA